MTGKNIIGKYVIARGEKSGVFFGKLTERDGQEVILKNCRRIWYWDGAASITQLATDGVAKPENCKFTVEAKKNMILDVIEIIPCTEKATKNIKEVPEWKIQ